MTPPSDSRRDFLIKAGLLAGAAAFAPSLSATAAPMPGKRGKRISPPKAGETIRIGVIGTGGMGTGHCNAIASLVKSMNCCFNASISVCTLAIQTAFKGSALGFGERGCGWRAPNSGKLLFFATSGSAVGLGIFGIIARSSILSSYKIERFLQCCKADKNSGDPNQKLKHSKVSSA